MAALRRPGGQDVMVKIRNLSPGGMMAECPISFVRHESIEVDLRGIGRVTGKIVWATGGRIGVAFSEAVDPRLARKPFASIGLQPAFAEAPRADPDDAKP